MDSHQPAAGWYADPGGSSRLRYFDGTQWTDHYHDTPAAQAPADGPQHQSVDVGPAAEDQHSRDDSPTPIRFSGELSGPGSLLQKSLNALLARIGPLLGIAVGMGIAIAVIVGLLIGLVLTQADSGAGVFFAVIAGYVAVGLLFCAYQLAVSRILLGQHQGQTVDIGTALADTRGRILPLFGIFLTLGVLLGIGLFVSLPVLAIVPYAGLLILAVGLYIWVKLAFLSVAGAASGSAPILEGSTGVSKGRFWAVLLRLLVLSVPSILWSIAITFVANAADIGFAMSLINVIGSLLLGLFVTSGTTLIYLESSGRTDVRRTSIDNRQGQPNWDLPLR